MACNISPLRLRLPLPSPLQQWRALLQQLMLLPMSPPGRKPPRQLPQLHSFGIFQFI